jgi:hypothetical protein
MVLSLPEMIFVNDKVNKLIVPFYPLLLVFQTGASAPGAFDLVVSEIVAQVEAQAPTVMGATDIHIQDSECTYAPPAVAPEDITDG